MKEQSLKMSRSWVWVLVLVVVFIAAWVVWYLSHSKSPIRKVRNVVVISIDTCRADYLSCYGFKRRTTPNIDALAREGVLFKSALSPVSMTLPAHSSMMTGTYPPTHGVHLNNGERLDDSNITLAEILKAAGYHTAAFISGFTLDSRFGMNQGFDTYECNFSKKVEGHLSERTGEEVNQSALPWLGEHSTTPFFLFLHYFDAHAPYEPRLPYSVDYADDLYSGEIAYVDFCIGQVVDRLRALGLYDNTLLIITSDHGESLGDHGEETHTYFAYNSTLHVPLVVHMPSGGTSV